MDQWLKTGVLKSKAHDSADKDVPSKNSNKKLLKQKFDKYCHNYLEFGFTWTVLEDCQKPLCVICYSVLPNECLKPNKLHQHIETTHKNCISKPIDFFKENSMNLQKVPV